MFRMALTIYPRRSSQLMVAVCSRDNILSSFRLRTNGIRNSLIFSQAQKCDKHGENQPLRQTNLKSRESGTSRPKTSVPFSLYDSVEEIFHRLGKYPKVDINQCKQDIVTIHKLYKAGKTKLSAEEICRAEEFEILTEKVGSNIPLLSIVDAVNILGTLIALGISSNSTTCQSLLTLISKRPNRLRLNEIFFLDYWLRNCARSPVVNKLQSTIPVVFERQVRSQLDRVDAATLARAVNFAFRCRSISVETRGSLVDAALDEINQFNAKEIVRMLDGFTLAEDDPKNIHDLHTALVTRLRENLDQLDPNYGESNMHDALTILKVLIESKTFSTSTTCQSLLRFISEGANGFDLKRIAFLDILLRKCARSPIVDKLQSTIPVVFERQVRSHLDAVDVTTLASAVRVALRCKSVSTETRGFLVDAALDKVNQFSVKEISCMLNDFKLRGDGPKNISDLHTALMTRLGENLDRLDWHDRNVTLPCSIIINYLYLDDARFNQEIIEKAIQSAIECDELRLVETGTLLRHLNRISYYCPTLLDYVDKQLLRSADWQTFPRVLLYGYVNACANCSYKPENWKKYEEKLVQFIEANVERQLFWTIGFSLMVLKCWSKTLVEYCLHDDSWRPDSEETHEKPYEAMMHMYQCVKLLYSNQYTGSYPSANNVERITNLLRAKKEYPLLESLNVGLGGLQYVSHGVSTKLGQIIDYLIVKRKNGELYPINTAPGTDSSEILYESLPTPEDGFPIAIVLLNPSAYCLDGVRLRGRTRLQLRCLEAYGITPIPVSHHKWLELAHYEKVPFLVYKIDACVPVPKSRRR